MINASKKTMYIETVLRDYNNMLNTFGAVSFPTVAPGARRRRVLIPRAAKRPAPSSGILRHAVLRHTVLRRHTVLGRRHTILKRRHAVLERRHTVLNHTVLGPAAAANAIAEVTCSALVSTRASPTKTKGTYVSATTTRSLVHAVPNARSQPPPTPPRTQA